MRFLKPISFILFLSVSLADNFDSLSYYSKFELAVQSYKEGRFRLAESRFSSILIHDKDYRDPAAQLMLAKSQYRQKKYTDAIRSGKSVINYYENKDYKNHANLLMGDIALSQGKYSKAYEKYLSIRSSIRDSIYLDQVDQRLIRCIANGLKEDRIEGALFKEKNPNNRSLLNLTRAYIAWGRGDAYDLSLALNGIQKNKLPRSFHFLLNALNHAKSSSVPVQNTLAVVLPLSGFEKEKGQSYLLGLSNQLEKEINQSIRFLVFDSQGKSLKVMNIFQSLARDRNIMGVVGPILDQEILSIAGLSSTLPILIPQTGIVGLTKMSDNLFSLSPSNKQIAERVAQLMVNEYDFENIAVLSPGTEQSKILTDQFIEELFQLGIDPITVKWYIEKPENISRQFKSIRKLAWSLMSNEEVSQDMTAMEIDSLDALFDVDVTDFFDFPEEEETMDKKDSAKVILETIHAIYMPVRKEELIYIGTQFPLYNLKTTVFGNENWLDMDILNQKIIGPHVQGMQIVSQRSSIKVGADTFSNYHDLGFDHAAFIQSISRSGRMNRHLFMKQLRNHPGFDGEFSSIYFSGKNQNENGSVQVLEYEGTHMKKMGIYNGQNLLKTQ